jgi:uncharacterized membrane protein YidH (DUF202 family)
MAGVQEENRLRIALMLMALGVLLIFGGILLGVQQYRTVQASQVRPLKAEAPAVQLDRDKQVQLIRAVLFVLLVLTGILAVSLYAFRRWSRRFRQWLLRKPARPTPSEDVWVMHRLPEDWVAEVSKPPPGPEPDRNG